jgi:hypothetical protein
MMVLPPSTRRLTGHHLRQALPIKEEFRRPTGTAG